MLMIGGAFWWPACSWAALIAGGCARMARCSAGTRVGRRGVTITPDKELDSGCAPAPCPYGAIEKMRAVRKDCSTARGVTNRARAR
jgi:hypothetical protein